MFGREILALSVCLQTIQGARHWVACVATVVFELLKADLGLCPLL